MIPAFLAAIVGAALVALPGGWLRVDAITCVNYPSMPLALALAAAFTAGVALLTWAWLRLMKQPPRLWAVFAGALVVYAVALVAPPYLSHDPLMYAAEGRAMQVFHGAPTDALNRVLPPGDPFLTILPERWQAGTSAYGPGWNVIARGVAVVAGDRLWLHLRLFQLLAVAALFAAAGLTAWARREDAARSAAMVLLCPLAVVDGGINAHNDALLAVTTAAFLCAAVRQRWAAGFLALVAGAAVKLSALIGAGVAAVQLARERWWRWVLGAAVVAGVVVVALSWGWLTARLQATTALFGRSDPGVEYCTRSIECWPRALLHWPLHAPDVARAVGLLFRVLAAAWLVWAGLRFSAPQRRAEGLAFALFIYYLYLHAWSQSWYLLPLLPLLPAVNRARVAPLLVLCVTSVLYYSLVIPFSCLTGGFALGAVDFWESVITIAPPTVALWRLRGAREPA